MSQQNTRLQVLLVEDHPDDLRQFERDFPGVFFSCGVEADIHPCQDFEVAFTRTSSPVFRYDLIVSDTYSGPHKNRDAHVVLQMIAKYRGSRFCPLVIYSNGVMPPDLREGPFVVWASKSKSGDIERAIKQLLDTNIPQLARQLHDDLERTAGSYLWSFLEANWGRLNDPSPLSAGVLERMVRRRAATQLSDIDPASGTAGFAERQAPEYYVYPAFEQPSFNLGDLLRSRQDVADWRVILTPHCHLFKQQGQDKPKADYALLVKLIRAEEVLGEKLGRAKVEAAPKRKKTLGLWARSPSQTARPPEGRHWYVPGFLDIPHSFCDFLQVASVPYETLENDFQRIATLTSPYAEALQSCFAGFYASVGIPTMQTESIESLLT